MSRNPAGESGKSQSISLRDGLTGRKRLIIAGGVVFIGVVILLLTSAASEETYPRNSLIEFGETVSFQIENVTGNRHISDLQIDVPYPNLVCSDADYVEANLVYPNWLRDPSSAEFQAHAQAHKAFDRNHELEPGTRSDTFYCLNYYRDLDNNIEDRAHYQSSLAVVLDYLNNNRRLNIDYRLTALSDDFDPSKIQVRLVSAEENLASKRITDQDLHWLLIRGVRSGNQLDISSELAQGETRIGSTWADISQETDSEKLKLEIKYGSSTEVIEIGDITPPTIAIEPAQIDTSPKQSLTISASSDAEDLDDSSWQFKLINSASACHAVTIQGDDNPSGNQVTLDKASQNDHKVCFKVADKSGNSSYQGSSIITGLGEEAN